MNNVNSTKINQSIRSDHKIVSFIINVNETEWGQGYWKINECLAFEWMDIEDFQMRLIDFKAFLLRASKFDDLQKSPKTTENSQTSISTCWKSLPEKFDCLKKMAIALLSVFGFTYLCEQIFSLSKFILSSHRSRLTEDHSEACAQLKVTRYSPNELCTLQLRKKR